VNADNFVVASEEPIISIAYELEPVPGVLVQWGLHGGPAASELRHCSDKLSLLARRSFERLNKMWEHC
jgi:hypothetical protein